MLTLPTLFIAIGLLAAFTFAALLLAYDRQEAAQERRRRDLDLSRWAEELNRPQPLTGRHAAAGVADSWRPAHTAAGHAHQGRHTAELPEAVTA